MPFENLSNDPDSAVVARLEMKIDSSDLDTTRAITQAAKDLLTAMESITRFSESHVDFMKQSLEIEKEISKAKEETLRQQTEADKNREIQRQQRQRDREEKLRQKKQDQDQKKQERQEDIDYRERLQQYMSEETREQLSRRDALSAQTSDNPDRLFEMLKERGFTSEGVQDGKVMHEINLPGSKKFDAAQLTDPAKMAEALDQLSKDAGQESGSAFDRLGGVSSNLGTLLQGLRLGGSFADTAKATEGLLGNLSKSGGSTGALAGAAGLAGKALPAVGGALALNGIFNQATDFYQNYRLQGATKGGGFGQGIEYEAQIRSLALSPFVSTDQARQIIMGAVNEGYTGKQFDDVVEFTKSNFTEMGVSINDSFKMIRTAVQQGGESLEDLAVSLEKIKANAKIGNMSTQEATKEFQEVSQSVVNAGYGEFSLEVTDQITARFKREEDIPLKGVMGKIADAFMTNSSLAVPLTRYAQQLGVSSSPPLVVGDLMESGQFVAAIELYLQDLANRANQSSRDGNVREPWNVFWQMLTNYGIPVSNKNEAKLLYNRYGGENGALRVGNNAAGFLAERDEQAGLDLESKKQKIADKASKQGYDELSSSEKALLPEVQYEARRALETQDLLGVTDRFERELRDEQDKWNGKDRNDFRPDTIHGGTKDYLLKNLGKTGQSLPELKTLVGASDGFQVYDEKGKIVSLKDVDWNNLSNAEKILDGKWKFTELGGVKSSSKNFEDFYNDFRGGLAQKNYMRDVKAGSDVGKPQVVKVEIEARGDLVKYLRATEGGTANQKRSNFGEAGATENNPSVGDR